MRTPAIFSPVLLCAALCACSASLGPPGSEAWIPDSGSILINSAYTGISGARLDVISDSTTWVQTWNQVYGPVSPLPPAPAVDFSQQSVVLAALGGRPTGGYSITVDSIAHSDTQDVIFVTDTSPGSNCVVPTVLTAPAEAVRTSWPVTAAEWRTRSATHDCS